MIVTPIQLMRLSLVLYELDLNEEIQFFIKKWVEPWRKYHNLEYMINLLSKVDNYNFDKRQRQIYLLFCLFHCIEYIPGNVDYSRENSIEQLTKKTLVKLDISIIKLVEKLIIMFHNQSYLGNLNKNLPITNIIFYELFKIYENSEEELIKHEKKIMLEYSYLPFEFYKQNRLKWLDDISQFYPNVSKLIDYINTKKYKIRIDLRAKLIETDAAKDILNNFLKNSLYDKYVIALNYDKKIKERKNYEEHANLLRNSLPFQIEVIAFTQQEKDKFFINNNTVEYTIS